jgi:4-amino-4-deoxy-L-arabinose transferase-like glycosyltransferase
MAVTFLFVGLTARRWWGKGHGRTAILSLMACVGLVYESHLMLTDVPMLTGFAIAGYGFSLACERPLAGGLWLGLGVGVGFLAKGLLVPSVLGVTALSLPALFRTWRNPTYARTLVIALLVALPWLLIWPFALWLRSPSLFIDWFWLNNVGRFLGFSVNQLGASNNPSFWPKTLLWFAFPALPLAALTVWRRRREIRERAPLQFGLVVFAVYLGVLLVSASARNGYGLPMLAALALLAAPSAASLTETLNRRTDWVAFWLFTVVAGFLWTVWFIMCATGSAPAWSFLTRALPQDFTMPFHRWAFSAALLATALWLWCWRRMEGLRERGLTSFAAGLTLCWLLFATLWLPWMDAAKSYRGVFTAMQPHLPAHHGRVASIALDESASAMLLYYCGVKTIPRQTAPNTEDDALLIQGRVTQPPKTPPAGWRLAWDGARQGDNREHFWLFVPATDSQAAIGIE